MKRRVMVASTMLLAISLGLSGCGGGGLDEGTPKDLTPGVPIDSVKTQMSPSASKPPPPPKVELPPATGSEEKK